MRKTRFLIYINVLLLIFVSVMIIKPSLAINETHNTLKIQIDSDIEHIDNRYRLYSSTYDSYVGVQWQGRLIRRSPGETVAWYPAAVESVTWNEDQTIYNFTLREGLTFHDGTAITARDVKYSFAANLAVYQGLGITSYPAYHNISEALDKIMNEFEFAYAADDPNGDGLKFTLGPGISSDAWFPKPEFLFQDLGNWNRFMLIPEDSNGKYTDDQATCEDLIEDFMLQPISSGPYKFKEHIPQDHISLERHDGWFGWGKTFTDNFGRNYTYPSLEEAFKEIQIRIIPEPSMARVELETGGVDVITSGIKSMEQIQEFMNKNGFTAFQRPALVSWMLQLNTQGDHPDYFSGLGNYPFTEVWFRKVLAHAINRTNIVQNVKGGIGAEQTSLYPSWLTDDYPDLDTSDYYILDTNPVKAIQILESHGYVAGKFVEDPFNRFGYGPFLNETDANGDGIDETRGYVFKMVVDTSEPYKINQGIAIAKDLENIGIYVETIMLDRTRYMKAISEDFSFPTDWGYNRTTFEPLPDWDDYMSGTKDPYYQGPEWDMFVGGAGHHYESPEQYVLYSSFIWWYWYGGEGGILIEDYEQALAQMEGGRGLLDYVGTYHYAPPEGDYPYPVWGPDDEQFVEAAEEAGRIFTNELLQYIPFLWDYNAYAQNECLKNFVPAANSYWDLAYCYWETYTPTTTATTTTTTTTTESVTSGFEMFGIVSLLLVGLFYGLWKRS